MRDIKFKHLYYNPSYLHGIEEAQLLFLAIFLKPRTRFSEHIKESSAAVLLSTQEGYLNPIFSPNSTNRDYRITGEQRLQFGEPCDSQRKYNLVFSTEEV